MKNFEKIRLIDSATIKEALKIIDDGSKKIALIIDSNNTFIGTVTDGDIRRGLLKGLTLNDKINSIIHRSPVVCNSGDSKEQILQIALEKKIHQIPLLDSKRKLVGLEVIDELLKPKTYPNKVVLMVGGLGTRLRPLTDKRPKPLLKVGNKPILETIICNFAKAGFKKIILCVNYKSEMFKEHFGNGDSFGVNINYVHEDKRMGTAGALSLMTEELEEPFFVMNGDLLTNINYENMLNYHTENKAIATMGVREYDFQVPYGVVNVNDTSITSIEEKPVHKFFVSGGVYLLNKEVLNELPHNTFYDMPTLFNKLIANKQKTISFPIREYWLDIGQMSDFVRANDEYRDVFKNA